MRKNYYKDEFVEMWTEDGIMYHVYGEDVGINLELAKHITRNRIRISEGISWPLLTDSRSLKSIDKEARDFWSKPGEGIQFLSAGALIINNPILRLLGNAFVKLDKPPKPFQLFTDYKSALSWLDQYKSHKLN